MPVLLSSWPKVTWPAASGSCCQSQSQLSPYTLPAVKDCTLTSFTLIKDPVPALRKVTNTGAKPNLPYSPQICFSLSFPEQFRAIISKFPNLSSSHLWGFLLLPLVHYTCKPAVPSLSPDGALALHCISDLSLPFCSLPYKTNQITSLYRSHTKDPQSLKADSA